MPKRDYIAEANQLGKSYLTMSRETGYSQKDLKTGNVPYSVKRNIYRRTSYNYAKEKGLSTEEARLLRWGTYGGKKLSTIEDLYHGRIKTLELQKAVSWADKTASFMREKWNREMDSKFKHRLEKWNALTPEERKAQHLRKPTKPRHYTDKQIRRILSKQLANQSQEEWEERLTQT